MIYWILKYLMNTIINNSVFTFSLVLLILCGCSRQDYDNSGVIWEDPPSPGLVIDTSVNRQSTVSFRSEVDPQGRDLKQDGYFLVSELDGTDDVYMEIIVKVDNNSGTNPFFLGWYHSDLNPGNGEGVIGYFILLDEQGEEYGFQCDALLGGEQYFTVEVEEITDYLQPVRGKFEGRGISGADGQYANFSGEFNVPWKYNTCGDEIIINKDMYELLDSEPITIEDVDVGMGCIALDFSRSGGCEDLRSNFIDSGIIEYTDPPQRFLKLVDRSNDPCEQMLEEKETFSLELLKIENYDHIILNIEGWEEPINFYY